MKKLILERRESSKMIKYKKVLVEPDKTNVWLKDV